MHRDSHCKELISWLVLHYEILYDGHLYIDTQFFALAWVDNIYDFFLAFVAIVDLKTNLISQAVGLYSYICKKHMA